MKLQWDPAKRKANIAKHGIDFRDCTSVFTDPGARIREDRSHGEDRSIVIGADDLGRVLVVAYTWRGNVIRVISARRASPGERRAYCID
jgi:uncharacterized DUF497 family protein